MKRFTYWSPALVLIAAVACEQPATGPDATPDFGQSSGLTHHASLGSNDACEAFGLEPGCDGNFSLTANQNYGSTWGQWQDTFAGGGEGVHVAVDCLNVQGNAAVVGGVITHGTAFGTDVSGQRAVTAVWDNGTSSNDAPDAISFSFFPAAAFFGTDDCTQLIPASLPPLPLTTGQVKVW